MPSHVILDPVVVDYCGLGVIFAVDFLNLVVDGIGPVGELLDHWVHWRVVLGVLAQGPVVLVADVCPTDFVVETVSFFVHLPLELLACLLLLNHLSFGLYFLLWLCLDTAYSLGL